MSDNLTPELWTIERVVHVLEHKAELISFPVPKYGEQHISLKMNPTALNTPLFSHGVDPIHELYVGVPDFRKEISDRVAACFNACKGIPTKQLEGINFAQPNALDTWHEEDGNALWWKFPVNEPPYCGSPLSCDWPGYHTHWTKILVPAQPKDGE